MPAKSRLLTLFLVIAAWFASVCVTMAPTHACCQSTGNHLSATLPSCCTGQWAVQSPDAQSTHPGFDPGAWVGARAFNLNDFLNGQANAHSQSWLASAHVPDQSGRYLELRVLLN